MTTRRLIWALSVGLCAAPAISAGSPRSRRRRWPRRRPRAEGAGQGHGRGRGLVGGHGQRGRRLRQRGRGRRLGGADDRGPAAVGHDRHGGEPRCAALDDGRRDAGGRDRRAAAAPARLSDRADAAADHPAAEPVRGLADAARGGVAVRRVDRAARALRHQQQGPARPDLPGRRDSTIRRPRVKQAFTARRSGSTSRT
jgi:hypothetical protein